jgi:hypothetical protein
MRWVTGERDGDGLWGRGGAVLDGEDEFGVVVVEEDIRVAETMVSPALC